MLDRQGGVGFTRNIDVGQTRRSWVYKKYICWTDKEELGLHEIQMLDRQDRLMDGQHDSYYIPLYLVCGRI